MVMKINGSTGFSVLPPLGQCYFAYTNATTCTLLPFMGRALSFCDGNYYAIPDAGVTITNSGLAASTGYYIYATVSAATISLVASTTGHSRDSTYGIEVQTGNSDRILVGYVYTNASSQFEDNDTNRLVLSWFNRRNKSMLVPWTSATSTVSTSFASLGSFPTFANWANEAVYVGFTGIVNITTGNFGYIATGLDGSLTPLDPGSIIQQAGANSFNYPITCAAWMTLSEGRHIYRTLAMCNAGTMTFGTGASAGTGRCNSIGCTRG